MSITQSLTKNLVTSLRASLIAGAGGAVVPPTPDWANWNQSQDSDSQLFFDDGYSGPTSIDFTGTNEFVALTRTRVGGSQTEKRVANVYSWDSELAITQESTLELSDNDGGTFPYVAKMTDTRLVTCCLKSGGGFIALIGKSGTTLSEIALDDTLSFYSGTIAARGSVYRMTDTICLYVYIDGSDVKCLIIDISGDTLSYGTPLDLLDNDTDFISAGVLTDTSFVIANGTRVTYLTRSGTTITEVSNIAKPAGESILDTSLEVRNENQFMVLYESQTSGSRVIAVLYTLTGTTLSQTDLLILDTGSGVFSGSQDTNLTKLDDNTFMFAGYLLATLDSTISNIVIGIDGDTLSELVQAKTSRGDHCQVKADPLSNGTLALLVTQDDTTTPTDKTNFRFLRAVEGWNPAAPLIPAPTTIFMIGDSTTDVDNGAVSNKRNTSTTELIKNLMVADSLPAVSDALIGYGRTSDTFPNAVNDSRATYTGTANANVTGRAIASLIQSTTLDLAYTPDANVDTFDIYMATGLGVDIVIDIDGGATATYDVSAGAQDFTKYTITAGSVGTHTLNVDLDGFLCGIIGRDSTKDQIILANCGVSSSRTSDWVFVSGKPWTMGLTWSDYGVDVAVINLSINDGVNSIATATMKANIQILIDQLLVENAAMKIILCIPNPYRDIATLQVTNAVAIAELGTENSLPVVDIRTAFGGDLTTAQENGLMADDLHPNAAGNAIIADLVYTSIKAQY